MFGSMHFNTRILLFFFGLMLFLVPLPAQMAAGAAAAKEGEEVTDFPLGDVIGGDGRDQLAHFLGQPVLLAWWQNISSGMDAARKAVELEQKYRKNGLNVLLVTAQGFDGEGGRAAAEAFLAKTFPGHGAAVVSNIRVPIVDTGSMNPPRIALIGVDRRLVVEGPNRNVGGKIEKAILAEFEKVKNGWGADAQIKKAHALAFGQKNNCEAYKVLLSTSGALTTPEHQAVQKELESVFMARLGAVAKLMESGEFQNARARFEELKPTARGMPTWEAAVKEAAQRLESAEVLKELALEKKVQSLLIKVGSGKADADTPKFLEKFAAENAGTRVARRAEAAAKVAQAALKN